MKPVTCRRSSLLRCAAPLAAAVLAAGVAAAPAARAQAAASQLMAGSSGTVVRHIQTDARPIAEGVWAGDTYYLSGQLADPIAPAAAPASGDAAAKPSYGDTRTQAASVFAKISKLLAAQGLGMKDVVKMTVFMVGEPATGKLDFPAMQSQYVLYFGTPQQPNKPARSAVQVAALAAPWALLEVEVVAVRGR